MAMTYRTRLWLHGAVASAVSAAANTVTLVVIDPLKFNLQDGWRNLLTAVVVSALVGLALYMKTHPLPDPEKDIDFEKVSAQAVARIQSGTGDGGAAGRMPVVLLALALTGGLLSGCGGHVPPALVSPQPAPADVQAVRLQAVRIAEGAQTALTIVDQAARIADSAPMPPSLKDAIDCSIIKVTGLSQPPSATVVRVCGTVPVGPGILHKALGVLADVTSLPSLRVTVVEILGALDPLLGQFEASGVPALQGFAAVMRVALGYSRQFLGGA